MATIRTPSSSRAVMRDSSNLSWRLLNHEVLCDLPADLARRTKSGSCRRAEHWPGSRLDQSLPGSRICSPPGEHQPAHLRSQLASLCPLVARRQSARLFGCSHLWGLGKWAGEGNKHSIDMI